MLFVAVAENLGGGARLNPEAAMVGELQFTQQGPQSLFPPTQKTNDASDEARFEFWFGLPNLSISEPRLRHRKISSYQCEKIWWYMPLLNIYFIPGGYAIFYDLDVDLDFSLKIELDPIGSLIEDHTFS